MNERKKKRKKRREVLRQNEEHIVFNGNMVNSVFLYTKKGISLPKRFVK